MRRYEDKEVAVRTIVRRECVEFRCDLCQRQAEKLYMDPEAGMFEYGSDGCGGGTVRSWTYAYGDNDYQEVDLCHECAESLIGLIMDQRVDLRRLVNGEH